LRTKRHLLIDCMLDHAIVVLAVDGEGRPRGEVARIVHDGPMWSFDALESADGALLVAAGGVEDHPLDRSGGFFGWVDSFVFTYRIDPDGRVTRTGATNLSAEGVVTPKAVALADAETTVVTGYGGDRMVTLRAGALETRALPPGTASVTLVPGGLVAANPLLDAWIAVTTGESRVVRVPDDRSNTRARSDASKIGEALFFTKLMAPWQQSEGPKSRFTCETCHFEGYVDGRTHYTGRADVHATTKPLVGLFNNRPHFSRALDPDLATMVNAEFRVAGAGSDADPWFWADVWDFPWLREMGLEQSVYSPEDLRRALMTFLMELSHRKNPATQGRDRWTAEERAGAEAFRDRCAGCHEARLVADDPASVVPFDRWEALVMAPEGAIVWGAAEYKKTGIEPYVHERGARVPSLRRLYKKRPYFTNGSAPDLGSVLERARLGREFLHDGAEGAQLDEAARAALAAFLRLL
jgi:hypothetical protein